MSAELIGTRWRPLVLLKYGRSTPLPAKIRLPHSERPFLKPPSKPPTVQDWVTRLPGRKWSKPLGGWVVWDFGVTTPTQLLTDIGFSIDLSHGQKAGLTQLEQLVGDPWVLLDPGDPHTTLFYPKLTPMSVLQPFLPFDTEWDEKEQAWRVNTVGAANCGLPVPQNVIDTANQLMRSGVKATEQVREAARVGAKAKTLDEVPEQVLKLLTNNTGDLGGFSLDLYPYQQVGALSILGGHNLLADEPGLGKTRQALACVAHTKAQRTILVVPPVVVTHWATEVEEAGLGVVPPKSTKKNPFVDDGAQSLLTVFYATRKPPVLPVRGVVVVADSLLTSRPQLLDDLRAWSPDLVVIDEAHRLMNWQSARSRAVRKLCFGVPTVIPLTGTPLVSSPADLCTMLALTGHLYWLFGGLGMFLEQFCRRDRFEKLMPRKRQLPMLSESLNQWVWVRRLKRETLDFLPKVEPVRPMLLDVDLRLYREAHSEVEETIKQWADTFNDKFGRQPVLDDFRGWAKTQLGLVTKLRQAAGLCKVPVAVDMVRAHVVNHPPVGGVHDDPLLVWAHHDVVRTALVEALGELPGVVVEVIDGATPVQKRGLIKDRFQDGQIAVLVGAITAAGVGLTLTRGREMVFVETDWNPHINQQAFDRMDRIGQTRVLTATQLLAVGTLDERIQVVNLEKQGVQGVVTASGGVVQESGLVVGVEDGTDTALGVLVGIAKPFLRETYPGFGV